MAFGCLNMGNDTKSIVVETFGVGGDIKIKAVDACAMGDDIKTIDNESWGLVVEGQSIVAAPKTGGGG
jgi:hypothetical protein